MKLVTAAILFVVFLVGYANYSTQAYSSGKTGQTRSPLTQVIAGCYCHGEASSLTTVSIESPVTEFAPGQSYDLELVVRNATKSQAGVDIAAFAGTLEVASGDKMLQEIDGELTHTKPQDLTAGEVRFKFRYKAPVGTATDTIYANGNATNRSGSADGDEWNFAPNFPIAIGVSKVASPEAIFGLQVARVPTGFRLTAREGIRLRAELFDMRGSKATESTQQSANSLWLSTTGLANGCYLLKLTDDGGRTATQTVTVGF